MGIIEREKSFQVFCRLLLKFSRSKSYVVKYYCKPLTLIYLLFGVGTWGPINHAMRPC